MLLAGVALTATLLIGTADQQLAKSNPRDYDFRSALASVRHHLRPGDTLLYAPDYLQDVIEYYAPGVHTEVLRGGKPVLPSRGHVFLLASFLDQPGVPAAAGTAKVTLSQAHRRLVSTDTLEKIYLWKYQ